MRKWVSRCYVRRVLCALLAHVMTMGTPVAAAENKLVLLPEASDPVLGERAAVVEWAWSPAYAKRFGLSVQEDGLKDGYLWLLGIKVLRVQDQDNQTYQCRIVGLIDNKAPMLTPPGDRFLYHPAYRWMGGLPTPPQRPYSGPALTEQGTFVPGQAAWYKKPTNQAQRARPHSGIGAAYLLFHRYYTPELAYFELNSSCWYFRDPEYLRNELRFPTRIDGKNDDDKTVAAVFEPSALKFDIPDGLMRRMYPYTLKAADWKQCLMVRAGVKGAYVDAEEKRRLGTDCAPIRTTINR
jgi:hypothetical protein